MSYVDIIGERSLSVIGQVEQYLLNSGLEQSITNGLKFFIVILLLAIICVLSGWIAKKVILTLIHRIVKKTKTDWDDILFENKVFGNVAHLVPAIILEALIPSFFEGYQSVISIGLVLSEVYLIIGITNLLLSLVKVAQVLFRRHPFMKDKPNESYAQLIRIVLYIIAGIYLFSVVLGKSPWGIFSALGAMSVVLMLVFKDTILGLVASIQLSANDMVRIGDWVDFPKYGADGTVLEIKLQTIKVENWDKTISTVPTYAFVADAFKNWRGMEESGGRRIKRAIHVDLNSIKVCSEKMLSRFCKIEFIESYVSTKLKEVASHNESKKIDLSS